MTARYARATHRFQPWEASPIQRHLDQLSSSDAAFLHRERDGAHMHFGSVALLTGPPPDIEALRDHVAARLGRAPRYRQRLAAPLGGLGRPRWIDDPTFQLDYHVRHTALPDDAGAPGLTRLAGRIFSQRLDRSKPLWELWLVGRVGDDAHALIAKTHHCLVDGMAGIDLLTALFDRDEAPAPGGEALVWHPRPQPSGPHLAARALASVTRRNLEATARVAGTVARPRAAAGAIGSALAGVAEVAWHGLNPAPPSPLNVAIGPHRRFESATVRLEDLQAVKRRLGGTVNDVVLATLAGGLHRFLAMRGVDDEDLSLRACVPVSVRSEAESGALGNRLAPVLARLPVGTVDPRERLDRVKQSMMGVKESKQALGAEVLAGATSFAPPTILAQAARLTTGDRYYNLLVVNVPGPQATLRLLDAELDAVFPVSFLSRRRALAVAVTSYRGGVHIGLLGDYDAIPDLALLADGVEAAAEELVALAGGRDPQPVRPVRTLRT